MLESDVCITHRKDKSYTDRNLRIYRGRQARGEDFSPRDLYYFANELRDHSFNEEALEYYEKFLQTGQGWVEDNYQACLKMSECYERLENKKGKMQALYRTLNYDIPRSEFCCRLGFELMEQGRFDHAVYWFEKAITLPKRITMGLQDMTSTTWVPHLQLCVCYDRLGQHVKANYHNEVALTHYPSHPSMQGNRKYFQDLLGESYVNLIQASS